MVLIMLFAGIVITPPVSSSTPTPTFDFLNVPGDNETIEEAYSWIKDGGTIMVASGTHLVSLSISRNVTIVSAGGPGSTTLKPRSSSLFSTSASCTISGFKVESNGGSFVNCWKPAEEVVVEGNIIINSSIAVHMDGFVFRGNSMISHPDYVRSVYLSGDAAILDDNDFGPGMRVEASGKNITITNCDFDNATVRVSGDRCKLSKCSFHDASDTCIYIIKGNATVSNCTFQDTTTSILGEGAYAVYADNAFSSCGRGISVRWSSAGSKVARNNFTDCVSPLEIYKQTGASVVDNEIWNHDPLANESMGFKVSGSHATVKGNVVSHTFSYGMILDGDNFTVSDNRVARILAEYNSSTGIGAYLTDSTFSGNQLIRVTGNGLLVYGSDTEYRDNLIQDCAVGIYVMGGSGGTQFIHNDLIGNNVSAVDASPGETWDLNLFSDYFGPDANGDGIGDVPYIISGGNQDPHPRIYNTPPLVGEINLGIAPITFPASSGDVGKYLIYDFDYYQALGEKLAQYIREVSYGSITVNVQVLREAGGEMFSLAESSSEVRTWEVGKFCQKSIEAMDDHVDFRAYDYREGGGRGIVALVTPFNFRSGGKESCIWTKNDYYGWMLTDEGVAVDSIYTFAQVSGGDLKSITQLSHEFSHFLGKLLITSRDGAKNGVWNLPDEYLMGNVKFSDSIMGRFISNSVEKVHLDSYCKEWLGWLSYEEVALGEECALVPLPAMSLHDHVMRHSYSLALGVGAMTGYYILEYRYRYAEGADWDKQVTVPQSVNIYQVEHWSKDDVLNLVGRIEQVGRSTVIPDQKLAFTLVDLSGTNCTVRVETADLSNMTGATLQPGCNVLNGVRLNMPHVAIYEALPDSDLHAYSEEGLHVGMNYDTGEYEVEIPGAICSGDLTNGREFIYVPSSYNPRFVADTRDMQEFMDTWPEAGQYTDGTEVIGLMVGRYGEDGGLYTSEPEVRELQPDDAYEVPYDIQQNQDGSYSVDITDVGVFQVLFQRTGLPANTEWKVMVDGVEHSTFISFMEVTLSEGVHSYTVPSLSGYQAEQASGTFTVSGPGTNLTVQYSQEEGELLPGIDTGTLMLIGGGLVALLIIVAVARAARSRRRKPRG